MNKEQYTRSAIMSARAQGCICNVTVEFIKGKWGVPEVNILHDDWCPLLIEVRAGLKGRDQIVMSK